MKRAIIFVLIFASVFAVNIVSIQPDAVNSNSESPLSRTQQMNNLQISNYTGLGITADMARAFVKVINDAYTFYPLSFQQNAQYIQDKLEGSYIGKFQVLIFPENSTASLSIYANSGGEAFVTWTKVNTKRPLWTYIIAILSSEALQSVQLDGYSQKGPGVSATLQKNIYNIISKYETGLGCSCLTYSVSEDLEDLDGQRWNVACSAPQGFYGAFSGYIYQKDGIYLQTEEIKGTTCQYLVWVI